METPIKKTKSESTQITNSIFKFNSNKKKNSTKNLHKNEVINFKKNFTKKKLNIYRHENTNNKLFGAQSFSYISKSRDKKIIFKEIKNICENIYNTSRNKNYNYRMKLKEDIVKSIDNYVFNDLRKNILFPKMFTILSKTNINLSNTKFFPGTKKKKEKKEKNEKKESFDSNKLSLKDILNKCSENNSRFNRGIDRKLKVYRYKYEDYAKNDVKYNHPQIYTLNNTFRPKINLPKIILQKSSNPLDFAKLIPEKKSKEKDFDKKLYNAYKTMKTKNKKEIGIYI